MAYTYQPHSAAQAIQDYHHLEAINNKRALTPAEVQRQSADIAYLRAHGITFVGLGDSPNTPGAGKIGGVAGAIVDAGTGVYNVEKKIPGVTSIDGLVKGLASGATWERALYVTGGGILILTGLLILARELGARGVPPAPTPARFIAKQASKPFKRKRVGK